MDVTEVEWQRRGGYMIDPIVVKLDIDWASLREQKAELIKYAWKDAADSNKLLEGIISIIDAIQDQAVDENGLSEMLVFGQLP
jgi:hypothetical protein